MFFRNDNFVQGNLYFFVYLDKSLRQSKEPKDKKKLIPLFLNLDPRKTKIIKQWLQRLFPKSVSAAFYLRNYPWVSKEFLRITLVLQNNLLPSLIHAKNKVSSVNFLSSKELHQFLICWWVTLNAAKRTCWRIMKNRDRLECNSIYCLQFVVWAILKHDLYCSSCYFKDMRINSSGSLILIIFELFFY